MTRGLTPPETLSKEDIQTLGDVRRDIYTNAAKGMAIGAGSGLVLHTGYQYLRRFGILSPSMTSSKIKSRNTLFLSILGSAALGSFVLAAKTGKEEVHQLHPIFQVGAVVPPHKNPELETMRYNQQRQRPQDETLTPSQLRHMRLVRRKSLEESFQHHGGLSDSHGAHWTTNHKHHPNAVTSSDNDNEQPLLDPSQMRQRRLVRRKSLEESFQRHGGLSDSHGAHWTEDDDKGQR